MKKYLKLLSIMAAGILLAAACSKDKPAPTATITSQITSNTVVFTVTATDAETYAWDFGDGSVISALQNPTHTYTEYGKTYNVVLTVTGPGGSITVNHSVTIAPMTKLEMLTGGPSATNGKKWKMSSSAAAYRAKPDASLTVDKTYPAGVLLALGYTTVYTDEYTFFYNKNFTIAPKGTGIPAGLVYCTMNSIANTPPSQSAKDAGLTLITSFTAPSGLTFNLNEGKTMTVSVTADGMTAADVTYTGVNTLSFSTGGFLGIKDFITECIIQEISASSMKLAYFVSAAPPPLPQAGKTTNVLIFSFDAIP